MKTNFKKTLAVLLAVLMLTSVFSVTAFAVAEYTITYKPGVGVEGEEYVTKSTKTRERLRDVTYTREGYVQAGWTTVDGGTSKDYNLKGYYTKKTSVVLYPYWEGVEYTVTFHPDSYTTSGTTVTRKAKYNTTTALPDAIFTRDGYTQTGWSLTEGGEKAYDIGVMSDPIKGDLHLYPYWSKKLTVAFAPGQYGAGESSSDTLSVGETVTLKGAIYTRAGYTQIGWTTVDGGEKEYDLYQQNVPVPEDVVFYPAWLKNVYELDVSVNKVNFGDVCADYTAPEIAEIVITNKGNVPLNVSVSSLTNYEVSLASVVEVSAGSSYTIKVQPKEALGLGDYAENFVIEVAEDTSLIRTVELNFSVSDHIYDEYKSAGEATYTKNDRLVAECVKGCGHKDYIEVPKSNKVFSVDNNDAIGLQPSYIHHRTVRFTAYGSGMDDTEDYLTTRYRPYSWYVNDEFNGEFKGNKFEGTDEDGDGVKENLYDVTFTHTIFGEYTLTVTYVEETKDATGEWVATGETDTKIFDYSVGTTAEEEQEIVRPNTILNIIFGLFAKLLELLGLGG